MALHGSAEQENFDPSLVPVSSIVTLAKVAQKLVNGNGTLTNPGNLQIGATGTTPGGNLTVTGNSTVMGNSTVNGTASIFGGSSDKGFMWSAENGSGWSCLRSGNQTPGQGGNRLCFNKDHGTVEFHPNGLLNLAGALTVPGITTLNNNLIVGGTLTMGNNGKVTTGDLQVNGEQTLPINKWHKGSDGRVRLLYYKAGGPIDGNFYESPTGRHTFRGGNDADGVVISSSVGGNAELNNTNSVNMSIPGTLNVDGTSGFGGSGEWGFKWGNENNNGWSCLRTNRGENRMCFHRDHGLAHFFPEGRLDIQGKITVPRVETTTLIATGGSTISGVTWMNDVRANDFTATGNLNAGGSLCIGGVCINADHLRMLNGQKRFQLGADSGNCVDAGDGRSSDCNNNQWKRFRFIPL